MAFDPARAALLDIRDNIFLARGFVEGLDLPAFPQSRLHVYAATRAIEIAVEQELRALGDLS